MGLEPAEYKVNMTSDRMETSITLLTEDARDRITVDALHSALSANGVVAGIIDHVLGTLAKDPVFNVPHIVARGTPGKDGVNEKVEYKFPTDDAIQLEESETGTIDFRNIGNFCNFRNGDLLAVKTPAVPGEPGETVTGEEVKVRDGKTVTLRVGKGAAVAEDGMCVVAEVDGHACLVADRITVMNTVEVPAHVDYSIGNINFIANVHIRGSVRPDFKVEAEGNIEIAGNVEKAVIKCGGDLTIHGNVFGQDDTHITVGGDASIGAINQAELAVRGNLTVKNYLHHTTVSVGGSIEVIGKKGNIIGGDVHAFREIKVPFVGNSMAALTKLTVGTNPFTSHELEEIQAQHDDLATKLRQVRAATSKLADRRVAAGGNLDPSNQAMLDKLAILHNQLVPQVAKLDAQIEQVKGTVTSYKEAKIRISDIIYPGVIISFRDRMQYKTRDEQQRVTFFEENAEISTGPY